MQRVICTLLWTVGRNANEGTSWYSPASRPSIAALAIFFIGLLTYSAAAQTSPQSLTTQARITHAISPQILAMHALAKRPVAAAPTSLELATATTATSATFNSDQGPGPGPIGPGPGCNLFPAPPSVGATVPLSYFGPSPSETNQSLVGPVQLLKSGTVDAAHGTITLPLYKGKLAGSNRNVWYILTDVSDSNVAAELGLNFSTKLQFSSLAARTGNLDAEGNIVFNAGTVNFAPDRKIIPGPPGAEFPPKFATPGAVGDTHYGPLVRIVNAGNVIYNAPMVAFGVDASQINFPNGNVDYSKVHDEVWRSIRAIENDTALRAFLETAFGGSPKVHGRVPGGTRDRGCGAAGCARSRSRSQRAMEELKGQETNRGSERNRLFSTVTGLPLSNVAICALMWIASESLVVRQLD